MKILSLHKILLLIADILVVNLSFCFALWLQYRSGIYFSVSEFPFHYLPVFFLGSLVLVLFFQLHSLYKYQFIENFGLWSWERELFREGKKGNEGRD